MSAFVYEIVHRASGKRYVGITIKRPAQRWSSHRHAAVKRDSPTHLHRSMRKHGVEAFDFRVVAGLPTVALAKLAEISLIKFTKPAYNMTAGGDGAFGVPWPEESRRRASESAKRKPPITEETRAKMSAAQRNSELAAANLRRMAEKNRGRRQSAEDRAKKSAAFWKRCTPEYREQQRQRGIGRVHSEETKAKMSAAKRRSK
jgi:group I intron endonuclease